MSERDEHRVDADRRALPVPGRDQAPGPVPEPAPEPGETAQEAVPGGPEGAGGWRCGLNAFPDHECAAPQPPIAIDEQGRAKGGQPAKYCTTAHRNLASRLRRQAATAATDQGLADLRALTTALAPTLTAQRAALDELLETFSQVGGTLTTRTAQAEADAQRARAEAAEAAQRAAAADADKVRALRAAREEKEAAARAQARARAAERAAEDSAANERAALRDHAVVAADLAQATERLATARRDKVTAEQTRDTLATHLTAAQESHAREAGRLRDQLRTLREAGAELERRLATTAAEADEKDRRLTEVRHAAERATDRATRAEHAADLSAVATQAAEGRAEQARTEAQRARIDLTAAQADATAARQLLVRAEAERDRYRDEAAAERGKAAAVLQQLTELARRLPDPTPPGEDDSAHDDRATPGTEKQDRGHERQSGKKDQR